MQKIRDRSLSLLVTDTLITLNRKIAEKGKIDTLNTKIRDRSLS
jgi:hypothetical protein